MTVDELNRAARFAALALKNRALVELTSRPAGLALAAWFAASSEARRNGWDLARTLQRAEELMREHSP
jgi:hypothetical protein